MTSATNCRRRMPSWRSAGTVVGGDDEGGREQEKSPQGHHGAAHRPGQLRQGGVQSLAVERDVALLVGQDPPGHIRGERVVGAIAQRPVVTQRNYFRDHQHQQFQAQAHQTPQPYENGVAPVAGQRRHARGGQQPGEETSVVLFLGVDVLLLEGRRFLRLAP
jgi:hypothetical protein